MLNNNRKKIKFDNKGNIIIPEYHKVGQLLRYKSLYCTIKAEQDSALITEINKEQYTITLFWLKEQRKDTYTITEALAKFEHLEKT